ncbi:MAG: ATP-dependent zinc protease, partial [Armatimonadetes bacterium]|nr:ATP-dependent zinc protease [Akkermansiaceae bacterium]
MNQIQLFLLLVFLGSGFLVAQNEERDEEPAPKSEAREAVKGKAGKKIVKDAGEEKPENDNDAKAVAVNKDATGGEAEAGPGEPESEAEMEAIDAEAAAVAKPVSPDLMQVYGWREKILIDGMKKLISAKLDTGAYTSSIHAEEKEMFERDGKKWVRFIVTEPRKKNSPRIRIEAPLVKIARIKEPGGVSQTREVVRLSFKIGERKLRGNFTLNNRSNMLSAILIGRTTIKELGWIDPTRTNLA